MTTSDVLSLLAVILGVPLLFIAMLTLVFGWRSRPIREKALRAWAGEHAMHYDTSESRVLHAHHAHFRIFSPDAPGLWKPHTFTDRLTEVRAFLDLFPKHLTRDLSEKAS